MALVVGVLLGIAVGVFATGTGLDRDRAFYPVVTIVVASYYSLFAVMGSSTQALILETGVGALFVVAAIVGFKGSLWAVVTALAAHGISDFPHGALIPNPGVPSWWPQFCGSIDVTLAAFLAWRLKRGRVGSRQKS